MIIGIVQMLCLLSPYNYHRDVTELLNLKAVT